MQKEISVAVMSSSKSHGLFAGTQGRQMCCGKRTPVLQHIFFEKSVSKVSKNNQINQNKASVNDFLTNRRPSWISSYKYTIPNSNFGSPINKPSIKCILFLA